MGLLDIVRQDVARRREFNRVSRLRARGMPGHDDRIEALRTRPVPRVQAPYVPYGSPVGSYGLDAHYDDRYKAEQEAGGEITKVIIPVTVAGYQQAFNPFFCNADGIQLMARTIDDSGNVSESSDSARVFIKINTAGGAWLPLGYGQTPQGGFKGDATVFLGTVKKFWVFVSTITQDPANQPNLILFLLRHVSIVAPSGSSQLYGGLTNTGASSGAATSGGGSSTNNVPSGNPGAGGGGGGDNNPPRFPGGGAGNPRGPLPGL